MQAITKKTLPDRLPPAPGWAASHCTTGAGRGEGLARTRFPWRALLFCVSAHADLIGGL